MLAAAHSSRSPALRNHTAKPSSGARRCRFGLSFRRAATSALLSRDTGHPHRLLERASGIWYYTKSGRQILDACGGSAVACLGHGNARVRKAISAQLADVAYCHSNFFTTSASERLAETVIASTDGQMASMLPLSSGSEAVEVALKIARQYFLDLPLPQPQRIKVIARQPSYHGATLTALGVGGHVTRRKPFEPMLGFQSSKVSLCNAYRGMLPGETSSGYVERLARELDQTFQRLGPNTVCAFMLETVTGASTGCVLPVEGYLPAMRAVCRKYGALLILDEIMCGMGRTGTMHAWQQEGAVPDIQAVGKGFGAGFVPVSGVLVSHEVNHVLTSGSGGFSHSQSFLAHPAACAGALEVQKIIAQDDMLTNVQVMQDKLAAALVSKLGDHPNVGDIRGRGLFWALEFVQDKRTKHPFPPEQNIGYRVQAMASEEPYNISVYPGKGTVDGHAGDHILLAPAYNVTGYEVDLIANRVAAVITNFFHHHAWT